MLNKRIKALRLNKGLTQKELANKLSLTPKMISFYELGDRVPPPDVLEKLADIFGVSTDYLLCRTDWTICPICYQSYDPLNEYDSGEHAEFHKKFLAAEDKYGKILLYGDADKKRTNCIYRLNNNNFTVDERIDAFNEYLKYEFMLSIWRSHFSLHHDNFETFCKKEMGLSTTKETLDNIGDSIYQNLCQQYGVANESEYHKIVEFTERDKRDIKKDLDNIMDKLSNQEYGPAAFDGQELSEESMELFKEELEIALRRLKLINKEKYNPNKNKK